jgi:hypothetical protein
MSLRSKFQLLDLLCVAPIVHLLLKVGKVNREEVPDLLDTTHD